MKNLSIFLAALVLVGCSTTGGMSSGSSMGGAGYSSGQGDPRQELLRPRQPGDIYYGD